MAGVNGNRQQQQQQQHQHQAWLHFSTTSNNSYGIK
jgi:hypothetical protein